LRNHVTFRAIKKPYAQSHNFMDVRAAFSAIIFAQLQNFMRTYTTVLRNHVTVLRNRTIFCPTQQIYDQSRNLLRNHATITVTYRKITKWQS
jgi:hypothetical protein